MGEHKVLQQPKISPDHSDIITEDLSTIDGKVICPIHYDYVDPSEMFGLTCGHLACKECLAAYLKDKIDDGKVLQIKCFDKDCLINFTREDV